jgi:hypothetical protein
MTTKKPKPPMPRDLPWTTRRAREAFSRNNDPHGILRAAAKHALSADASEPLSADTTEQLVVVPDRVFQNLGRIATALEDIATFMRVITSPPGTASPTAEVPLQTYMSGQWRRRAGDIYDRVAEPGSPNAGTTMADEMFGTAHDAPEKQDE